MHDAMVFVDAQNFHQGAKKYDPSYRYDAIALHEELTDGYHTVRAYWFDSYGEEGDKEGFFYMLNMEGYQVIATPLRQRCGKPVEKGVDIRLATELLAQAFNDSYDTAFLVSGDGDFVRAIDYVQGLGKRVVIASWAENISTDLKRDSDEYIELDEMADAIER